jgi:hypothetical protein
LPASWRRWLPCWPLLSSSCFARICCRVRFVMRLPHRETRAGWIERWRKKDGHAVADAVEKEVRERWAKK